MKSLWGLLLQAITPSGGVWRTGRSGIQGGTNPVSVYTFVECASIISYPITGNIKRGFLMNKKLIFLAMPALILALFFAPTGCGTTSGSKNGPQLRTTITGIPSEYNGKLGWITFDTGSSRNDPTVAWAMGTISNGSVTFNMLDQKTDQPYNKTGNYFVMFLVWEDLDAARAPGVDSLYTGIIMSRGIGETNSIGFSELTKM
jgi:hypothetical protein